MTAHPKQALERVSHQQVLLHLEFARSTTHRIKSKAIVRGRGEPRHTGARSVAEALAGFGVGAQVEAMVRSDDRCHPKPATLRRVWAGCSVTPIAVALASRPS